MLAEHGAPVGPSPVCRGAAVNNTQYEEIMAWDHAPPSSTRSVQCLGQARLGMTPVRCSHDERWKRPLLVLLLLPCCDKGRHVCASALSALEVRKREKTDTIQATVAPPIAVSLAMPQVGMHKHVVICAAVNLHRGRAGARTLPWSC
jgi:hypothetical protein